MRSANRKTHRKVLQRGVPDVGCAAGEASATAASGAGPRVPPTRRDPLLRTTTTCGREHRTPPVGQPTRGRGVSTVGGTENLAQGATEGGARCRVPRRGGLSNGRQRVGAQALPHLAGRTASDHDPLRRQTPGPPGAAGLPTERLTGAGRWYGPRSGGPSPEPSERGGQHGVRIQATTRARCPVRRPTSRHGVRHRPQLGRAALPDAHPPAPASANRPRPGRAALSSAQPPALACANRPRPGRAALSGVQPPAPVCANRP